jgi:hypothetical protein
MSKTKIAVSVWSLVAPIAIKPAIAIPKVAADPETDATNPAIIGAFSSGLGVAAGLIY